MGGRGSNGEELRADVTLIPSAGFMKALSGLLAFEAGVGLSVLTNDEITKTATEAGRSPAFLIAATAMAGIGSVVAYSKSQKFRAEDERYAQQLEGQSV